MMIYGRFRWRVFGMLLALNSFACLLWAGGSGLNTLVVINQNSANSVELGNYYAERRQIPPENVLRISWSGGNTVWDATQFQTNLLQPLLGAITARGLSNQIQFVVLSMDIPFAILNGSVYNGTTAALYYGLKTGLGLDVQMLTNSYFASEKIFAEARPTTAPGYSFLTTMLTAGSLAQAKALVDQGVNSDATFPTAPVLLAKSSDALRRLRYPAFDDAIFNARLLRNYSLVRTNTDATAGFSGLLGLQTGLWKFTVSPNTFVPGAMADSMTSFGGVIFGPNDQTSALAFIHAGAAGSYGTVTEPTANIAKFPHPQIYFYQARGFSLAECYYQGLDVLFQGLIVGEPLAAPFAQPAAGAWIGLPPNATLSGTRQLAVNFTAADATRPLRRVDLFVNGNFFQTITNINPAAGNQIKVRVSGQTVNYVVPTGATLSSVATGLAAALNAPAVTNETKAVASAIGDRVQLRLLHANRPGAPSELRFGVSGTPVAAPMDGPAHEVFAGTAPVRTTFIEAAHPTFLESTAHGIRQVTVTGSVQAGTWLRLSVKKVSGATVTVGYTNQVVGVTPANVLSNLFELVNAAPELQGSDGVMAEDFTVPGIGSPWFNLLPRRAGWAAAGVQVALTSSGTLIGNPGVFTALNANLKDLQPRNHFYLSTGAEQLAVTVLLNTTTLPDGHHEMTAVAYEGSHVATQSRVGIPVRIQNTPLAATLNLVNLGPTNSVAGTYQIEVTANTNTVNRITLYSTGGARGTITNQASATFSFNGSELRAGRHPFYAEVETANGWRYRTETQWVRLQNP
jgi:uncharacterized protein (TIGR03790 family)